MDKVLILLCMIFCHIIADYNLQGILASMKQKKWWEANAPEDMYKQDYKVALFMHSFSWTFMVLLVPTIYLLLTNHNDTISFIIFLFISNLGIHYEIDDMKANKHWINLVADQAIHIMQIVLTWIIIICLTYSQYSI